MTLSYRRILIKLSGEALMGSKHHGIDYDAVDSWAKRIKELIDHGVEVACVIGAGNIFRGLEGEKYGLERTPADHMGMLGTIINGIALQQGLRKAGLHAALMSAIDCRPIAEPYHWDSALEHLENKQPVIFVGGTGSPYFTTDTAASLRACEIGADVLVKATKVDGVYSKDPIKHKDAIRYDKITYSEVLQQKLGVCDATAVALLMESKIPILVCNMHAPSMVEVLKNHVGTWIL